ncbi:MAG: hypothetical protein L0H36_00285 [bacterium]|nr:hypothetical protein [bacterium]MDN5835055.1 hypothetical protein [bacterium]
MEPSSTTTYDITIAPVEMGYMYALIIVAAGLIIIVAVAILNHLDSVDRKFFATRTTVMFMSVISIGISIIFGVLVTGIVLPQQVQDTIDHRLSHQIGTRVELHEVIVIDDSIQNGFTATDRHGKLIEAQVTETGHNQYRLTLLKY